MLPSNSFPSATNIGLYRQHTLSHLRTTLRRNRHTHPGTRDLTMVFHLIGTRNGSEPGQPDYRT